jgi:hypothetical protein
MFARRNATEGQVLSGHCHPFEQAPELNHNRIIIDAKDIR